MVYIKQAIVVEGRYDQNTLSQVVSALIIKTSGFGVFKDEEKLALLRRLAATRGLILMTDPDGAGFVIRNYLKGALPQEGVLHAYVPPVQGRESRRRAPSKEGLLGVEGHRPEVLLEALRRAGATFLGEDEAQRIEGFPGMSATRLYEDGLLGGRGSAGLRQMVLERLRLPRHMSAKAMVQALKIMVSEEEYRAALEEVHRNLDIQTGGNAPV